MGRHADTTGRRSFRVPFALIAIVLVVLCAVALGIWWWKLKSASDPIGADPVDAYGVVVSSPSCAVGGVTTVTVSGIDPPVTATLNACGYRVGEQLAIQYRAGQPEVARLAGTSTAGAPSMAARLLPIGILAAGLIAVLATISLLAERRRSRHQAAAARAPRRSRARIGGAEAAAGLAEAGSVAAAERGAPSTSDELGGGPESTVGAPTFDTSDDVVFQPDVYGAGYAASDVAGVPVEALENAVVIDEGMLFTHAYPEPPEPAGAPVELSGEDDRGQG